MMSYRTLVGRSWLEMLTCSGNEFTRVTGATFKTGWRIHVSRSNG